MMNATKEKTKPVCLRTFHSLSGYPLRCVDGEIGRVRDILFDDETMTTRYLVARPGGIFNTRKVLISTEHIESPKESSRGGVFPVNVTKDQIKGSPPLASDAPVSRRYEQEYRRFHSLSPYWMTSPLHPPVAADFRPTRTEVDIHRRKLAEIDECHLRSCKEVIGYSISATDGEIGTVGDMIIDTQTWKIRYLVVDIGVWLLGRSVLIDCDWLLTIHHPEREIRASLAVDQIKCSPDFDPNEPINRSYEKVLYDYYGKPQYW